MLINISVYVNWVLRVSNSGHWYNMLPVSIVLQWQVQVAQATPKYWIFLLSLSRVWKFSQVVVLYRPPPCTIHEACFHFGHLCRNFVMLFSIPVQVMHISRIRRHRTDSQIPQYHLKPSKRRGTKQLIVTVILGSSVQGKKNIVGVEKTANA